MSQWSHRPGFAPRNQQIVETRLLGEGLPCDVPTDVYYCVGCGKDYRRLAIRNHRHPQENQNLLCFDCAKKRQNGETA
jgi:DNA-directed RNA polymerase subunit RPC12/RpoP